MSEKCSIRGCENDATIERDTGYYDRLYLCDKCNKKYYGAAEIEEQAARNLIEYSVGFIVGQVRPIEAKPYGTQSGIMEVKRGKQRERVR